MGGGSFSMSRSPMAFGTAVVVVAAPAGLNLGVDPTADGNALCCWEQQAATTTTIISQFAGVSGKRC